MASVTLSQANTTFCLDLFKELGNTDKTANVFFSPFSISSALAMVMLGARGNTKTQMSEVRHSHKENIHEKFNQLLKELNKANAPYALSVANRLYGEQSYKFVQDYLKETEKYYNAALESVDFKSSFEMVRTRINTWVEDQTQGKIKGILAEGAVSNLTRLVLVNAIYFKGDWNKQFEKDATRDDEFRINKNEMKPVKMMNQKAKFPLTFVEELNLQVRKTFPTLSLRAMALEKELTYDKFMKWTDPVSMSESEVRVALPRFKMTEKYDMKRFLTNMGMVDVFDVALSDLSGMSTANDLVVSKIVHKAFVDVNEEGTEAAAATAVTVGITSVRPSKSFTADHPFLFFIRHNASMSVLFAGRYCSPE
uniref:Serpin B6 n=1 Tax=Cynoglossus semilaevis TaxID=244447 RepID=A0A3P8W0D6_CYNSE